MGHFRNHLILSGFCSIFSKTCAAWRGLAQNHVIRCFSLFWRCRLANLPERYLGILVALHPRPQIASDLGRNVTRSSNPHLKSQAIPGVVLDSPIRNPQAAIAELGPPKRPQIAKSLATRTLSQVGMRSYFCLVRSSGFR